MTFIDNFLAFFTKATPEVEEPSSIGTCSMCWGFQVFDKNVREIPKRKDIDIKNHKDNYMKLQKFVVEHVEGEKTRKIRSRPFRGTKKRES